MLLRGREKRRFLFRIFLSPFHLFEGDKPCQPLRSRPQPRQKYPPPKKKTPTAHPLPQGGRTPAPQAPRESKGAGGHGEEKDSIFLLFRCPFRLERRRQALSSLSLSLFSLTEPASFSSFLNQTNNRPTFTRPREPRPRRSRRSRYLFDSHFFLSREERRKESKENSYFQSHPLSFFTSPGSPLTKRTGDTRQVQRERRRHPEAPRLEARALNVINLGKK